MKNLFLLFCLSGWPSLGGGLYAQTIDLRISVHVILNPTTGARPAGVTDQVLSDGVDNANVWMGSWFRGHRYRLAEVIEIGGPADGGNSGPSQWYGQDFRQNPSWSTFQSQTKIDPRYHLRSDKINVYVATGVAGPGNSGGGTPIPPGNLDTAMQAFVDSGAWWLCHELGHFFGLRHTFDTEVKSTCTPGDDGLTDTLLDSNCWTTRDQVASYHYGVPYSSLNANQKSQVDNVFYNVMSYHDYLNKNTTENHMTELQLDRFADHASGDRSTFATGITHFVSLNGNLFGAGTSTDPVSTVLFGVAYASAAGGDIVLLRPGNYNEKLTITKPVTLRAPRTGWVTIGKP